MIEIRDGNQAQDTANSPPTEEYELQATRNGEDPTRASATTLPKNHVPAEITRQRQRGVAEWYRGLRRVHYVPTKAARDHLANERVFLGYIRTATALANFAITALQLYRLNHVPPPRGRLSDFDLGVPIAATTLFIALALTLVGVWRFMACQNAMALKNQIVTSSRVVLVVYPIFALVSMPACSWTLAETILVICGSIRIHLGHRP
jgi:uncharacterized membrane protein YidH (DUF202 family)